MNSWFSSIQGNPLFGILLTSYVYSCAVALWKRYGTPAGLHPVLVSTAILSATLLALGFRYEDYLSQVAIMNDTLALVIVLLAVPLWRNLPLIASASRPIGMSLIIGSIIAVGSAVALPSLLHSEIWVVATLAPKSTTAAVAVQIAEQFGGIAGLTAVIVISTGLLGAVLGPTLLGRIGVEDERAQGFALGLASHALGTARACQISDVAGAFASVGMVLNALVTAALVPLAMALIAG